MKILAIADEEAKQFYDFYRPGCLDSYDLILSCGDLPREYLEFLVTMGKCPLLYVKGNHDERFLSDPPQGCICLDDTIFEYQGVRFLGLGGSYQYRDGALMFTEPQMKRRILKLLPQFLKYHGFDVLVTHAPARHLNDLESLPHRGFACFNWLMKHFQPAYFVHGHVHLNYGYRLPRKCSYGSTQVINAYGYYEFEFHKDHKE